MRICWDGHASRSIAAALILLVYILSLLAIEFNRRGWLPAGVSSLMPRSHYAAISIAFTFFYTIMVFCDILISTPTCRHVLGPARHLDGPGKNVMVGNRISGKK